MRACWIIFTIFMATFFTFLLSRRISSSISTKPLKKSIFFYSLTVILSVFVSMLCLWVGSILEIDDTFQKIEHYVTLKTSDSDPLLANDYYSQIIGERYGYDNNYFTGYPDIVRVDEFDASKTAETFISEYLLTYGTYSDDLKGHDLISTAPNQYKVSLDGVTYCEVTIQETSLFKEYIFMLDTMLLRQLHRDTYSYEDIPIDIFVDIDEFSAIPVPAQTFPALKQGEFSEN